MIDVNDIFKNIGTGKPLVFALGVFDGVHLGHQAVIAQLLEAAAEFNAEPVIMYFDPFPGNVLHPENSVPAIMSIADKEKIFQEMGVSHIIRCPFSNELAVVSPADFINLFFVNVPFLTKAICVGDNWRFGQGNAGNADTLRTLAGRHDIHVRTILPRNWGGQRISSTRIRQNISQGDLMSAAKMMGRYFSISATVEHGKKIAGNVLHFPTINLCVNDIVIPKYGVYAANVSMGGSNNKFAAIAYVGDAPTFRSDGNVIWELHILDFDGQCYENNVRVELLEYLRPSIKFNTPNALQNQIVQDIKKVRELQGQFTDT